MQTIRHLLFTIFILLTSITLFAQVSNEFKTVSLDGTKSAMFGTSIAIDGDYAVIGVRVTEHVIGCAYVFKREGTAWKQVQKLTPPFSEDYDMFGFSVAISGDYIVIGAYHSAGKKGYAAIYKLENGNWKYKSQLQHSSLKGSEKFGYSVAIDGEYVVVGAPWQDVGFSQQGAAYVYKREGELWDSKARLLAKDGMESAHFGWSVSISQRQILVGAPGMTIDGGSSQGAVYLFVPDKEIWKPGVRFTQGVSSDEYGISVDIKDSRFIVGAVNAYADEIGHGAAYIYKYVPKDTMWIMEKKLISSTTKFSNYYGSSVSIDGDYALVSDNFDEEKGSHAGAAFLYKYAGGKWVLQKKMIASDAREEHEFGFAVTLHNHDILISSPNDEVQAPYSGSVYFYKY